MILLNTFDPATTAQLLSRLHALSPTTKPLWGKMSADQMLAHLNVAYDFAYGKRTSRISFFEKLMLKLFVKKIVTGEKPYAKNSRTAPEFIISNERDFENEKNKLINNIKETEAKGAAYFDGRKNASFGVLTVREWSNLFYKHLNHHFTQFGI